MKVYHLSQTLRAGDRLVPDYSGCARLAEPFAQGLARGADCFAAMVLSGNYLQAVMEKYGRREWSNCAKWAAEGAFEYVRRSQFPHRVSRLACNYFYTNIADCRALFQYDWGGETPEVRRSVRLLEVELEAEAPQRFDMKLYDLAYDALRSGEGPEAVIEWARRYFSGESSGSPVWEYLSDRPARAVNDISYLLED